MIVLDRGLELVHALQQEGIAAEAVGTVTDVLRRARELGSGVAVVDVEQFGATPCHDLVAHDVMAIAVTTDGSCDVAGAALRAGAYDVVLRSDLSRVTGAVTRALQHRALVPATGIAGSSHAIRRVIEVVNAVARTDDDVAIIGEQGVGKALVARSLVRLSPRRAQPCVTIECGAPRPLVEAELAFAAFTGTIVCNDVGALPRDLQCDLAGLSARLITTSEQAPVGLHPALAARPRVAIVIPPLRERSGDILELARVFVARAAARLAKAPPGLSTAVARMLMQHTWPGNVRELELMMGHATELCSTDQIELAHLPGTVDAESITDLVTLAELERRYVRRVMSIANGNKARAARILGIDRRSLHRRLQRKEAR